MAWSAPMTAVAGAVFSAAQFNQYVRDNLNETGPAKVTAANQILVSTGSSALAARTPDRVSVLTSETTTSVTYADLATTGPSITATTGTKALVWFGARLWNSTGGQNAVASVAVSGASTVAAADDWALTQLDGTANNYIRASVGHMFSGLTTGSNIFTMKYKCNGGTASFANRTLIVIPL